METAMTKLFLLVLSFFGRKPPKPAPAAPAKLVAAPNPPPAVHPRIRTLAQQARDTVELLHRHERAHVLGVSRPSNEAAAVGWAFLEDHILPIAGYLRACIHLEMSWPLCPRGADPDDWLSSTLQLTAKQIETIVTAIRTGASLRAWRAVEDIMARDVEHQLRGCKPVTIHLGGPEARREVHLRDSYRSA
ncbi:MAG TPA: hypothetical protein VHC94_13970, partial [Nitrobacter sp.]|nr:hypothetical protein [Nitrobacter sp.]